MRFFVSEARENSGALWRRRALVFGGYFLIQDVVPSGIVPTLRKEREGWGTRPVRSFWPSAHLFATQCLYGVDLRCAERREAHSGEGDQQQDERRDAVHRRVKGIHMQP